MRKPLVYIAGPISHPDPLTNTRAAVLLYRRMIIDGYVTPFCPHLSILVPLVCGAGDGEGAVDGHDFWLPHDFEIISHCDGLYRMDGASKGADLEVDFALDNDIPVFRTLDTVYFWAQTAEMFQ